SIIALPLGPGPSGIPEVPSGTNPPSASPPPVVSATAAADRFLSPRTRLEPGGEAVQTITEECERLFCDILWAVFLGERHTALQQSLVIGAIPKNINLCETTCGRIRNWIEVWDYSADTIYRGFVAADGARRILFVFFENHVASQGLKSGLMALFELASVSGFDCSEMVACVDRSMDAGERDAVIRNLGWVGFELSMLNGFMIPRPDETILSGRWLFMSVEVALEGYASIPDLKPARNKMPSRRLKQPISSAFPTYLLPSIPFTRRRSRSSVSASNEPDIPSDCPLSNGNSGFLHGHQSFLRCARCATDLCLVSQIISKGFTGRHGRAYLVSASPSADGISVASSSPGTSLPNTVAQQALPRQLVTGAHTVSDITCRFCDSLLGWKYVAAEEESQKYKVGKYILETKKISTCSSWENESNSASVPSNQVSQSHDDVEFDSQDEEECEDLFSGMWSPWLAARRRRNRNFEQNPPRI
ncbi:hypothetical protein FQN55_008992, partial [Onygenales sp. PD_40]